jgi:uncharacterized DUF497 family protein
MKYIHFDWDESKNKLNISKHKISFDEAKSVFYDPHARIISDPEHDWRIPIAKCMPIYRGTL